MPCRGVKPGMESTMPDILVNTNNFPPDYDHGHAFYEDGLRELLPEYTLRFESFGLNLPYCLLLWHELFDPIPYREAVRISEVIRSFLDTHERLLALGWPDVSRTCAN
jgi:hypothetical protein